jgi:hypothetical protein
MKHKKLWRKWRILTKNKSLCIILLINCMTQGSSGQVRGSLPRKKSPHFMVTQRSLPCSQKPGTVPYSEPDESIPYPAIQWLNFAFQYCPSIYGWMLQTVSLHSSSSQEPVCISFLSRACNKLHQSHPPWFYYFNNIC